MGLMDIESYGFSDDTPGISVIGIEELKVMADEEEDALVEPQPEIFLDAIAKHVTDQFRINKDAKETSGVTDLITEASQQYNGEYTDRELGMIREQGGSDIFMNLTATKCRAAASWIRDIELAVNQKSWTIKNSPMPDIPEESKELISSAIQDEFKELVQGLQGKQQGQQGSQSQPTGHNNMAQRPTDQNVNPQVSQQEQPSQQLTPETVVEEGNNNNKKPTALQAQETIREVNQSKRDIQEAIYNEIVKEAEYGLKVMERQIDDQLREGQWYEAFSQFIDDFVVYPSAFLKGPIVTKKPKTRYKNGRIVTETIYCYNNRRVSPYDIYPAPEATSLYDGALCEHLRLTATELNALIGVGVYKTEKIVEVLSDGPQESYDWMDSGIETEKAEQEKRGDSFDANRNIFHGIHFFGPIRASVLVDWGIEEQQVLDAPPYQEFECEAIIVGNVTIKCVLNKDPLLRRPYYSASYQQRPGSVWGRSLPDLMRDIQRMCNATARSLANNMAIAAGPQVEVYVDRLADQADLEDIRPFKIWQVTLDPTGAGGRAITFNQPTSNANELLAVYKEFESRADDATGIPRYAYGNEASKNLPPTLGSLSILLESASKGIKDAVRNIDAGVIVPRIEYQFYMNILDNQVKYTGDPQIVALGSSTLTLKGSEQIKRNEFLQITANQIDQQIMGVEGRATLLREMAKDLGFVEDIVPSRLDMKKKEKEQQEAQAQQMQQMQQMKAEEQKASLQATQIQVDGQKEMASTAQATKKEIESIKAQLKAVELQLREKELQSRTAVDLSRQKIDMDKQTREIALKMKQDTERNNNNAPY